MSLPWPGRRLARRDGAGLASRSVEPSAPCLLDDVLGPVRAAACPARLSPDGLVAALSYMDALLRGSSVLLDVRGARERRHQPGAEAPPLAALGDAALALATRSQEAAGTIAARFDPRRLPAADAYLAALVADHARLACDLDVRLAAALLDAATPRLRDEAAA